MSLTDPATAPPSAPQSILVAENDMITRRPNVPTGRPITHPPTHVVASSMTAIPAASAASASAAEAAGSPNWCTTIAALQSPASDLRVPGGKDRSSGSESTRWGRPPARTTARSIEPQANAGIATCSPATSPTRSATARAADPDETATAAGTLERARKGVLEVPAGPAARAYPGAVQGGKDG